MTIFKSFLYRLLAALMFFTRLPWWRLAVVPKRYFERVVPLWPLTGWLTGGVMALTYWGASQFFSPLLSVVLALLARVLLTGALHEDGLADFCDGFGGGHDRESTLRIMKDSHIGTYGVLGLLFYFLVTVLILSEIVCKLHAAHLSSHFFSLHPAFILFSADVFAKWVSSNIVDVLPYARSEAEAKNRLIYQKTPLAERCFSFVAGVVPTLLLLPLRLQFAMFVSALTAVMMMTAMFRRLRGYTGDCCGACFLFSELMYYFGILLII